MQAEPLSLGFGHFISYYMMQQFAHLVVRDAYIFRTFESSNHHTTFKHKIHFIKLEEFIFIYS